MKIDHPATEQIPALRTLWKRAFFDDDAFLDAFFRTAFSPERCRCVMENGRLTAALYWFDCTYTHGKIAYIYAVATDPGFRGQGLCRKLMDDTHTLLKDRGYAAAVLVPGEEGLFAMYRKMGYETMSGMDTAAATPGEAVSIKEVTPEQYAAARKFFLPRSGVVQEGENLAFLHTYAKLYAGEDFVLAAASSGDTLTGLELLGNAATAPGILAALGKTAGTFRIPGGKPFAMCHALSAAPAPGYFGLAFD